jgi:recombination protein RecA
MAPEDFEGLVKSGLVMLGSQSWSYETIPTGIRALDELLEGGLPKHQITELYGPYGSGKSTIVYHALAANMQEQPMVDIGLTGEDKKPQLVRAAVVDTEGAFDKDRASKIGADMSQVAIMRPEYGEQALDAIWAWTDAGLRFVLVDSMRGLVPRVIVEGGAEKDTVGAQPRMFGKFFPKYNLRRDKATLLCVNQVYNRINVTAWMDPYQTPGGNVIKHAYCLRLDCRRRQTLKKGDRILGQEVVVRITKSKYCVPFRDATLFLVYDRGFVTAQEWDKIRLKRGVKASDD